MSKKFDSEEDLIPPHRHRSFTRYIVLSDGKTFDILSDCKEIEVPDSIDDVGAYIKSRLIKDHPTFWVEGKDEQFCLDLVQYSKY